MEISTALRLSAAVGNACLAKQIRLLPQIRFEKISLNHTIISNLGKLEKEM